MTKMKMKRLIYKLNLAELAKASKVPKWRISFAERNFIELNEAEAQRIGAVLGVRADQLTEQVKWWGTNGVC
jgi:hypothetical protein